MQPEPFKDTTTILSTSIIQANQQQPSQHGLRNDENQLPILRPCGGRQGASTPRNSRAETLPTNVAISNGALATPTRRVSPEVSSKGRSPVDRIAEYENAMLQSVRKKDQGPKFKLVPISQKRSIGGSAIAGFPNGW